MNLRRWKGFLFPYGVIGLLVILSYFPTFSGEFILDDRPLIKHNLYLLEPHSMISALSQEDGRQGMEGSRTGYYRPLIGLTYRLDYILWGMNPSGFRTTNLVLHLLCTFVLFHMVALLAGSKLGAFWIALLFAVHPVNTESVAWISSRNNVLVTFFTLSCLFFYVVGQERAKRPAEILSIFLFVGALLSKEFGLVVLPLLFLYHRFLSKWRRSLLQELLGYCPFVIIAVAYLLMRVYVVGSPDLALAGGDSVLDRVFFAPYLTLLNFSFIVFPFHLHSLVIPYPQNHFSWEGIGGIVFLGLYGLLAWRVRKNRVLCFSMLSFLISLLPVLNILRIPSPSLVSMRWLYLPMACLLLGLGPYARSLFEKRRGLAQVISGLIVLYCATYSFILNKSLWHREETFFELEVRGFGNWYYAVGLAERLLENKEYEEAEKYFLTAMEKGTADGKDHVNYSALLIETGRAGEAISVLRRAAEFKMGSRERGELHNNMGMALFHLGKTPDAVGFFRKAVVFCPAEPRFWGNLAGAYGSSGDYESALKAFRMGLEVAPDSLELKKGLSLTCAKMGEKGKTGRVSKEIRP